jgi:Tfp pilus assembly protein PilV
MPTFFRTPDPDRGRPRRARGFPARALGEHEEGFLLIEVIISALLIALIVVATLTGFEVVNRTTADARHHSQAALLAAQSQEQLRSDPASALNALESTPHEFKVTVGGTVYTTVQTVKGVSSSGTTTGCSVFEATAQTGANFLATSTVSWPLQVAAKREPVRQASLISPPTGSALEIDAYTSPAYTAGVPGVTATAKFIPAESPTPTTVEGTTGANGCVVLTGIPATVATLEIAEKARFVTTSGALRVQPAEVTIAPNITTHQKVVYNEGGKLTAQFTYKGETVWGGKEVTGDTFVAFNSAIPSTRQFYVGSTSFEYEKGGEEHYKPITGGFAASASTAAGARYLSGDLFPFPSPSTWVATAGDCPKNKVEGTEASGLVEAGKTTAVKVPLSHVQLNLKAGTTAKPGALETTSYPVTITSGECSGTEVPANASAANLRHGQSSSTEGHLSSPFQPFGKYELCVYSATTKRIYLATYENKTAEGSTLTIYPGEPTKAERETQEATERSTWKTEEFKGKITAAERTSKESAQKSEKTTLEGNESTRGYKVESGKEKC